MFGQLRLAFLTRAAALVRPPPARGTVVPLRGEAASLALFRRIVPGLRMRRPGLAIDAQIQWRHAAETRRRGRTVALRGD